MAGPLSSYPGRSGDQPDSLKLPATRSLTDLSSPSSSSATSPPTRPLPWPLHQDTGSKGGPSSISSSSSRLASGTPSSSSSSSAQSAQNIAQLPRPLLQRPVSTPGRPSTTVSQPHPFFDRGRKSSLYVSPPPEPGMQPRDDREALAARELPDDALTETEDALRLALRIVSYAKEPGNSLTQEAAEEACRETSRALFVLQAWSEKNRVGTRALLQNRGQRSAAGDVRSSARPAATRSEQADLPVSGADHPRRHATVVLDAAGPYPTSPANWIPPPMIAEVPRPAREARAVYEGFDPESEDLQPRPPTTVKRTQNAPVSGSTSSHSHGSSQHSSAEAEASYMYAPPSIRNRLANLHKEQQRVLPPILPSQPPQQLYSHDWERSNYRHGPTLVPIGRPDPRWCTGPAPSATQGWPPGAIELSQDPRSHGPSVSPDRHHGQWSDGQGTGEIYSGENEGGVSKYKKRSRAPAPSACRSCGTSETPEWRRGPDGARTLCNACGLHFAKVAKRKPSTGEEPLDDAATAAAGLPPPPRHRSAGSS